MWRMRLIAAGLLLIVSAATASARDDRIHESDVDEEVGHEPITWVGTVLVDIFYIPAKLVYSTCGAVTGALAWALTGGSDRVAHAIWDPAVLGTYVVTPSMMEGKDDVCFSGP